MISQHLDSADLNRYVEHYLTNSTVPFPIEQYPNIEALAEAVLRKFSLRNLSSTTRVGTGAVIRPVEAAYQDEIYRALHAVLGFSTNVSSEWAADGNGRIDFRLADVGWGIELLREGSRLGEHCQRFTVNGSYAPWIRNGLLKDWLIIDCRTSHPHPYSKFTACWASAANSRIDVPGTKLWRAVFADDFSSVEVLDWSNKLLISRFSLMS